MSIMFAARVHNMFGRCGDVCAMGSAYYIPHQQLKVTEKGMLKGHRTAEDFLFNQYVLPQIEGSDSRVNESIKFDIIL